MKNNKQNPVIYEKEKGKIKISGDPDKVNKHIWFDQVNSSLLWMVPVAILLFITPKISWLPVLLQWLKKAIPLVFFAIVQGWQMLCLSV